MKHPKPILLARAASVAILFCAASASLPAFAVTATKEYVDKRDAATLAAATNAANAYTDEAVKSAAPADYAAVSNAAMTALQPAATNGLVTASVTNGLASAASVAQEATARESGDAKNAAAIAAEKQARLGAGYLTAESDPAFAAWTNGTSIVAGYGASSGDYAEQCVVIGAYASILGSAGVAIGTSANARAGVAVGDYSKANGRGSVAIGGWNTASEDYSIVIGTHEKGGVRSNGAYSFNIPTPDPSLFYFNSFEGQGSTARNLQSYLDERATTDALAEVKAAIPVISATDETFSNAVNVAARALVKAKLESLDKAKSSIGETIAALQSIYTETETK